MPAPGNKYSDSFLLIPLFNCLSALAALTSFMLPGLQCLNFSSDFIEFYRFSCLGKIGISEVSVCVVGYLSYKGFYRCAENEIGSNANKYSQDEILIFSPQLFALGIKGLCTLLQQLGWVLLVNDPLHIVLWSMTVHHLSPILLFNNTEGKHRQLQMTLISCHHCHFHSLLF